MEIFIIFYRTFISHTGRQNQDSQPITKSKPEDISTINDLYSQHLHSLNETTMTRSATSCPLGEVPCRLSNQCIHPSKWCDQNVDCSDATDETQCTCLDRLTLKKKEKLCDGYIDCPDAADEVGCFGCDPSLISCYRDVDEYIDHNHQPFCYSKLQRCDNVHDCFNGKDEEDCSRIVSNIGQQQRVSI